MKSKLLVAGVLLSLPILFGSCRSCKGGGWYGDRNLNIDQVQCDVEMDKDAIKEFE